MSTLKIALVHNLKPPVKESGIPEDYYSECDSQKTVDSITRALQSCGYTVFPVEGDAQLPIWLAQNPVDLVFNIAEGFHGESREARVPALLDLLGIPYTGSGVLALTLALDKCRSKQIFRYGGVPTPNFQLFLRPDEPLDKRLHFPLIVKPNQEGSGKGIWASSVVRAEAVLRSQIEKVMERYSQEVLVEEFIDGTELTVGLLGDQVLPVLEVDFTNCAPAGESFYSWRVKEFQGNEELHLNPRFWCPARLDAAKTQAVQAVAVKAAKVLGCRDLVRVDIRLSSDGIPYVLEVNPLPGLDPEESNVPLMIRAAGMTYEGLIRRIVEMAVDRSRKLSGRHSVAPASAQEGGATSSIPLFEVTTPGSKASQYRALPDSMEQEPGSPGSSTVALKGKKARNDDLKEEDLGR